MRLSDYILAYLADRGVTTVFGVTGAAIADLIDAFTRTDRVRFVVTQHEQAAANAAEGLARMTGGLGVAVATSGPGGTNLLTGIANCWYDSIPALFITGQINSKFLKTSLRLRQVGFQENDIVAMARPITKYAIQSRKPQDIRYLLDRLYYLATSGRPGPVLLDIPVDVLRAEVDLEIQRGTTGPPICPPPLLDLDIERYLAALSQAERPVLLIGGGVRLAGAVEAVRELGRVLGIPCIPTWNALDVFASDYDFYRGRVGTYGGPGRNFAVQNSDLLLAIGCRMSGRITGGLVESFARGAQRFSVDIDPALLDPALQTVKAHVNIECDAAVFIAALIAAAQMRTRRTFGGWLELTAEWRDKYNPANITPTGAGVNPYVFVAEMARQLTPRDVIVSDTGGNAVVVHQAFKTKTGQRLFSSHGHSAMGHALGQAIGACYAPGVERVICLIGDGGLQMSLPDLQTIRHYNLPIKIFVFNNGCYGIIKSYQDTNLGGRYTASGPDGYSAPDFENIMRAYNVPGAVIESREEFADIATVLSWPGPAICDVRMPGQWTYEPRIWGWQTGIEDQFPYLDRAEFRRNMLIPPMPGWETPAGPGGMLDGTTVSGRLSGVHAHLARRQR